MKTIEILVNAGFGEFDHGGFWQWPKSMRAEKPRLMLQGDNLVCWSWTNQRVLHSAPVYSLFPQGCNFVDDQFGEERRRFSVIEGLAFAARREHLPELNWNNFAEEIAGENWSVE